jgi:3-(3-hydroxy-phenyl)propionate hydroxylase
VAKTPRVIIVGAGPVGLVAALRLVRAGFAVTVLEQAPELHAEPRASTFHCSTLDLLDTMGLAERLVARGREAPLWQYRMFETGEAAVFDMSVLADETRFPFRLQAEQFKLVELAAEQLAAEAPGTVRFGAQVTGVSQTADQVSVICNGETLTADWLLACDGASSVVRIGLGLGFDGETYPVPNVTLGIRFDFTGHIPGLLNVNYFWSANGGSFSMFYTRDMWRMGYSPPRAMSDEEALAPANIQAQVNSVLPRKEPYDIAVARLYRIHKRIASEFRVGRILLAGDSAHLNSPSGGFGMNGGVQDAFNLTDKLAAVARGADQSLLDRYARQRRAAAVADIQATSDAKYKRHREPDPEKRRTELKRLQAITADRARMKEFLMESALISSWRRSEAVP